MPVKGSALSKRMQEPGDHVNFFSAELKTILWAEKHLLKALPKWKKPVAATELKTLLGKYSKSGHVKIKRLEQIFEHLHETARAKKSEAMAGIIEEVNGSILQAAGKGSSLKDMAVMVTIQKLVQYQVAAYTGLVQLAHTMGNEEIIPLLEQTLAEEQETNDELTAFAGSANGTPARDEQEEVPTAVYDSINLTGKHNKT